MRYKINENTFENVDCEEKAYFLGLLYADGNRARSSSSVSICLKDDDSYILEKFKEYMCTDKPLYEERRIYRGRIHFYRKMEMWNKKIAADLLDLGLIPAKTLVLKFPTIKQVPLDLIWAFLRGYFDGDGTVGIYNNLPRVGFCGAIDFCQSLFEFLQENDIRCKISKDYRKNCYYVTVLNKEGCMKIKENFYKDAIIYLERKRSIFDNYIPKTYIHERGKDGRYKKVTQV